MSHDWMAPGTHVSLDDIGLGGAYILGAGEGQHSQANNSLRTLLARAVDTHDDLSVLVCSGDESPPTMPHFHRHTTETVFVLDGVVRIWVDDQNGTRFTRDLQAGEFGLLPRNWIHAWAFAAPNTKHFGIAAPGGFERIVEFLDPTKPTSIEQLRESEKYIDVRWLPDYPLFDLCRDATAADGV